MRSASWRAIPRNGWVIVSYTLTKGLTNAIWALVYNLFLLSLHYKPALIGILDAMPAVTVLLVSLPFGILADRIGRKSLLLICALINPLTLLGLIIFHDPARQVIFGLANGVVGSFYWIAYPAIIAESADGEGRQVLFALNSFVFLGIGSCGYLLGGVLTTVAGRSLHLSSSATDSLSAAMFVVVVVGLIGTAPLLLLHDAPRSDPLLPRKVRHDIGLYGRLLGPDLLSSFGAGAILSFNQLYFAQTFHLDAAPVGFFLTLAGLLGAVGTFASPGLVRRFGAARATILLQGISAPLMALLALASSVGVAIGVYMTWVLVRSAIDPTYTGFAMAQVPPEQRSTLSGLYSVTWAAGFSAGPLMTGIVRETTGSYGPPFLIAAAGYLLASIALYVFFVRRSHGGIATPKS